MRIPLSKLEVKEFQPQPLEHDTDVVIICPTAPDFLITGTYSLLQKHDVTDYPGQVRCGMINVKPVNALFRPTFPGQQLPVLASHRFPAAVVDAHFHPRDLSLLGVSLSNSEIHFFRFVKRAGILDRRIITELLPLGFVKIAEKDQFGLIPLVTQFRWLDLYQECGSSSEGANNITICLTATTSSHDVLTVKVRIPGIKSTFDHRLAHKPTTLQFSVTLVHSHENEAWTVASIPVSRESGNITTLLLSGADDCKLIASTVHLDASTHVEAHSTAPSTSLWTDSKSHSYGVTAILPIPAPIPTSTTDNPPSLPLLTGSYDEHLRLFTLNPNTHRRDPLLPHTDLEVRGGVWRIKLMDYYIIPGGQSSAQEMQVSGINSLAIPPHETHYVLLVPAMHACARIVRLIHKPSSCSPTSFCWTAQLEAYFLAGHSTLVYAADSRREWACPYNPTSTISDDHCDGRWDGGVAQMVATLLEKKRVRVDIAWAQDSHSAEIGRRSKEAADEDTGRARTSNGSWKEGLNWHEKKLWEENVGMHTIVSAGFYDRQLCTWQWKDERRKGALDVLEFLEGCARSLK